MFTVYVRRNSRRFSLVVLALSGSRLKVVKKKEKIDF